MKMKHLVLVIGILLVIGSTSSAEAGDWKFKGLAFGDYYYVASADAGETKLPEKRNAFQFRRIYLTAEKDVSDNMSMRYRLEANDSGFGGGSKMNPFVKHAYLKWKDGVGSSDLYLGLSGTPTWAVAEGLWGYRAVEKTVLDLNKIGSSADIGVALKGKSYHLMVGNGPGQSSEDDNGKKFYGSVKRDLSESLLVEGYADFNMRPGDQNQLTLRVLAGLKKEKFRGGLEVFSRTNMEAGVAKEAGGDVTISGVSAYGTLTLSEQWKGFGRLDAVSNNDMDTTDLLIIAGLDREVAPNAFLMPNIYVQLPDGPDPNIQARLTFHYKY